MELWRQYIRHWYPKLSDGAYFIPPVHMNRVFYDQQTLADMQINIPRPPEENPPKGAPLELHLSTAREDETYQRILFCLKVLVDSHKEPVVVMSQLNFGDYLGEKSFAPAVAAAKLPRAVDLKDQQKRRGDFDILLLHKHYGVLAVEIKTVGDNFDVLGLTEEEQDKKIKQRIERGIKQLNKDGEMLIHLISDLKRKPRVRKLFMLPNITRSQLRRVLTTYPQVEQDLRISLDISVSVDPADICLTADELFEQKDVESISDGDLENLWSWWRRAIAGPFDVEHEELVARFAGPATTVNVFSVTDPPQHFRSQGEGVIETSRRFTRDIVLLPGQLDVLNRNDPIVCLSGPPGVGKTVVLVVRASDWLSRGWHVHVLCLGQESLAASFMIVDQLQNVERHSQQSQQQQQHQSATLPTTHVHHIQLCNFHVDDLMDVAVRRLVGEASKLTTPFCVLADEAYGAEIVKYNRFADLCNNLHQQLRGLHIWGAGLYCDHYTGKFKTSCVERIFMKEPLRTPPLVTIEVQQAYHIKNKGGVMDYTSSIAPLPSKGSRPRVLQHCGEGHSKGGPEDCEQCGKDLAAVLRELHVGVPGQTGVSVTPTRNVASSTATAMSTTSVASSSKTATYATNVASTSTTAASTTSVASSATSATSTTNVASSAPLTHAITIPAPLAYSDVFVLTSKGAQVLFEEEKDDEGKVVKPATGLVRGLRAAGIPVSILSPDDCAAIKDVAENKGPNKVIAASTHSVCGLERPIVVWVETRRRARKGNQIGDELYGRLLAMSRTTSQLIWLSWPIDPTAPHIRHDPDVVDSSVVIPLPSA